MRIVLRRRAFVEERPYVRIGHAECIEGRSEVMSNAQHMLVRVIAVAVLMALHWFPHTHAAPLATNGSANDHASLAGSGLQADGNAERTHAAEPVGVATIP